MCLAIGALILLRLASLCASFGRELYELLSLTSVLYPFFPFLQFTPHRVNQNDSLIKPGAGGGLSPLSAATVSNRAFPRGSANRSTFHSGQTRERRQLFNGP